MIKINSLKYDLCWRNNYSKGDWKCLTTLRSIKKWLKLLQLRHCWWVHTYRVQIIGISFWWSGAFISGLHLEEALELEGHHLPVITGVHWEGHPVTGRLRQYARWGRLTKLGPCIAWTSLGGQKCAEVRDCTFPVLIITGGKTDRSILLCRHGLPRLWRPVVDRAFVIPAMPVMVKGS